jgi:epoxyqueuosine reductase
MTPAARAGRVKLAGRQLGFERVAIGPADPPAHGGAFEAWLGAGHAGSMAYLERTRERRLDPRRVLPGARSVVACAAGYYQGARPDGPPGVARYAWGEDYHVLLEPRLRALGDEVTRLAPGSSARAYVDTGPVLERDLAARAGLGWIGKNTMLLHPALGSFFFIGVVLTTAELAPDEPVPDRCGTCTRCLDACPTGAFIGPHVLDARRCIAYLTIEHRGAVPGELRPGVGGWLFGCDVCQDVCPWNRRAPATREPAFAPRALPDAGECLALDEAAYRARLRRSPLARPRRSGLARNAAVVLGNAGRAEAVPELARALRDPDPTVRGHVAWALGQLGGPAADGALREALAREADEGAREEIDRALARTDGSPERPAEERT